MKPADLVGKHIAFVLRDSISPRLEVIGATEKTVFVEMPGGMRDREIPAYLVQYPTMGGYPGPKLPDETYLVFEGDDQPSSLHEALLYSTIDSALQFNANITREQRLERLASDYIGYFVQGEILVLLHRAEVRVRGKRGRNGRYIGPHHSEELGWPYVLREKDNIHQFEVIAILRDAGLQEFASDLWVSQGVARRAVLPHFTPAA